MDGARNFAIHHLSSPALGLSPAHRISLGLGYRITEWLKPAFGELLLTPACQLTVEDFALLGIPVVHLIMAMQASIFHFKYTGHSPHNGNVGKHLLPQTSNCI